ncbi:MAG: hypothetical protein ACHQYP_11840 [Nitrospiria bacterium]
MRLNYFSALLALLFGAAFVYWSPLLASESVNPITVKLLLLSPDEYDGKTVRVSGRVQTISAERGKRGSEYLKIVIEDSQQNQEQTTETLNVFIYSSPRIKKGSSIIVSGIYHKSGHWGGSEQEHFIEASLITPIQIN